MTQIIGDFNSAFNTILNLSIDNSAQLETIIHFQKKLIAELTKKDDKFVEDEYTKFMVEARIKIGKRSAEILGF